jgi:SRSO17 transposase
MDLSPRDLDNVVEALREYHAIDSPLFQRREQREGAEKYLHGLLLELPRQSIEPLVLAVEGANAKAVRTMPLFISDGTWDDDALRQRHWQEVETLLGEDDGVLTLDGRDFVNQGQESVGVKRQSCGAVGQRANGQAGVYLGYASRTGYTLLDRRLYVPQEWVEDEACGERRRRCGVPRGITFQTKPTLGGELMAAVHHSGSLRVPWVPCDEAFGRDTSLLDHIDGLGLWYVAEVPHDTPVWRQRPATAGPAWSGQGRKPTRTRVLAGEAQPAAVAQLAAWLPAHRWVRRTIQEGSTGPLVARVVALRVIAVREGWPGPEVWLVLRRNPVTGELKTSLGNAPADTRLATLVRLSGMRWPLETCVEDGKQSLGMGDDEVRSGRGWHHHRTRCLLAHGFLVRARLRLQKSPGLDHLPGASAVGQHLTPT